MYEQYHLDQYLSQDSQNIRDQRSSPIYLFYYLFPFTIFLLLLYPKPAFISIILLSQLYVCIFYEFIQEIMSSQIGLNLMNKFLKFSHIHQPLVAPFTTESITIPNPSKFYNKLNNIRKNPQQLQFVSDFDYTITKFRHNHKQCDSLFGMWVKGDFLPKKFIQALITNYREFGPYETDATISFEERVHLVGELYRFQTKSFEKFRITEEMAEKVLNNGYLVYRSFTTELLEKLKKHQIPLYIISGGISDSISNSIYGLTKKQYSNISIHSNELEVYTPEQIEEHQGKYVRFKKNLIHSYNKYKVMNHLNKKKNCFLMGDLVSDIYMAEGNDYENILSIFYAKQGQNDQRALAERKFDIIVEGDSSHRIIIELIKVIYSSRQVDWQYLISTKSNIHQLLI